LISYAMNAIMGPSMSPTWAQLDANVVSYFNPLAKDVSLRQGTKHDWPLWRMDYAVTIAFAYLVVVLVCKFFLDKGARPAPSERKKLAVSEKIKKEGVVMFSCVALYNLTQVLLCGWMVYRALAEHRRRGFKLVCNVHDLADDGMAFVTHCFYLSKALDFADTAFMIIKGNWRQVSFLHVYHHFSIFLFYWLNAQCNYDGDAYFSIVLNGSIHFVMYGYYLVTTFNITVPMFIKKAITNAQLTQFCCMEAQGVALLVMEGCGSSRKITILYMVYISTMLVLFMNFKKQNYKKISKKDSKKDSASGGETDGVSTAASEGENDIRKRK